MLRSSFLLLVFVFTPAAYGQNAATTLTQAGETVRVPVLVEDGSGQIAYGISAGNFSVEDDGVQQAVHLMGDGDPVPVSLCLVLQTGHNAASQADKIEGLGDLVDSILSDPNDQIAVMTFGNRPHLSLALSTDSNAIAAAIASGDSDEPGASLFDALHMAVTVLDKATPGNDRVILVISGEHDHGSYESDTASLDHDVLSRNISIYSFSFSAEKKGLVHRLLPISPAKIGAGAMERNAPESLANLTGGDFYHFDSRKDFDSDFEKAADHIHNRYDLALLPHDPQPGFHSLRVAIPGAKVSIAAVRRLYWIAGSSMSDGPTSAK